MNKKKHKRHETTPRAYLKADKKIGENSSLEKKANSLKREDLKDVIPADVETSINPFQFTDEDDSSWDDILSDTEVVEHSSPEIMRFEDSNFSEQIISPLELPRRTINSEESVLNFSPKLASSRVEYSFENSAIFDRPVHQSTKLGICLKNKNSTVNVPDIFDFETTVKEETDSLEDGNSLPSTVEAPDIFNFEAAVKDAEGTSCITRINAEENIYNAFEHPDEPSSPNFDRSVAAGESSGKQCSPVISESSLNESLNNSPVSRGTSRITTINTEENDYNTFEHPDEPSSPNFDRTFAVQRSANQHSPVISESSQNEPLNNISVSREKPFITTINTEDIVDTVFKHSDEPSSPNFDDAFNSMEDYDNEQSSVINEGSLSKTLKNTPLSGRKEHEKIGPKRLFFHSKSSILDLSTSNISQSNLEDGKKRKKSIIPICSLRLHDLSSSYSNRFKNKRDPYHLPSEESELDAQSTLRNCRLNVAEKKKKARKETTGVENKSKSNNSRSLAKAKPLSKKKFEEYMAWLETIPICPLSLQNSSRAEIEEEKSIESDEI